MPDQKLNKLLLKLHKDLNLLREREARYAGNAPPELINQITDYNEAINLVKMTQTGDLSEEDLNERLAGLIPGGGISDLSIIQRILSSFKSYYTGILIIGIMLVGLLFLNTLLDVPMLQVALSPTQTFTPTPTVTPSVTPTPLPTPITTPAASDELLVIIAEFENTGSKTYKVHRLIYNTLQQELAEIALDKVRIFCCAPVLSGDDSADMERAKNLGQLYNAAFVIWGWSDDSVIETKYSITKPFGNNDLTIQYLDLEDFALVVSKLPQQMAILTKFSIGQIYFRDQEYQSASQVFASILQDNPTKLIDDETTANIFFFHGFALQNLGDEFLDQSLNQYRQAINLDPALYQAYYNSGVAYAQQEQYEKALQAYDKAITNKPDLANAYLNRGDTYWRLGKLTEASADFEKIMALSAPVDTQVAALINWGQVYYDAEDIEQALACFERAIKLNPDMFLPYFYRGWGLLKKGEYTQAQQDYQQAIQRLNPQVNSTHYLAANKYLAWIYYLTGDYPAAIRINRSALAEGKNLASTPEILSALLSIQYNLALALLANGQEVEAETAYTTALELTKDPTIMEEFIKDLEDYLANHPNTPKGREILEKLRVKFKP